jgi:prepilin-type processing-associated H-X9-DG protein
MIMPAHKRNGLSTIELLVVTGVSSILMSLLLPAVQAAREVARRAQCGNNLRQIGIGLHAYHDLYQAFPLNTSFGLPLGPMYPSRSWMQGILPMVEQEVLASQIRPELSVQANLSVAERPVALFLCPTTASEPTMTYRADVPSAWSLGVTNYKSCAGSNWEWGEFFYGGFGAAGNGLSNGNGLLCAGRSGPIVRRMADIYDGTSNTFAVGEVVPEWTRWSWWFHSNSTAATCAIPLNLPIALKNPDDWTINLGFASRHPGGAEFLFVDGNVRFVSEKVDGAVYRASATIQGSEAMNCP